MGVNYEVVGWRLGEVGSRQGEDGTNKVPQEVHFVKNGIQHLAKGNTRRGGATYVLKACLEHVRVVLSLTKGWFPI